MIFREAQVADIKQMQVVRHAVKENRLSNPALVTDEDCREYITVRGKGWVCEIENTVVGFAIADLKEHNIWALFVHPDYEGLGIGKKLHASMLDWYFANTGEKVWLSTATGTRAERFYRLQGWKDAGLLKNGEMKFEMRFEEWKKLF
ncbi:MAG TPA: GNAT family N-acetyltransferase [Flavisolibacter sp.]|nr:GNAT family N-acetyltransferase [Flavisolibacter sp.]